MNKADMIEKEAIKELNSLGISGFLAEKYFIRGYIAGRTVGSEKQWISVEERLPNKQMDCLVTDGIKVEDAVYTKRTKNDEWKFVFTQIKNITHWQPFPEPPKLLNK